MFAIHLSLHSPSYNALRVIVTFKVSVIKAKVNDELGMPTGKQKLQIEVSDVGVCC